MVLLKQKNATFSHQSYLVIYFFTPQLTDYGKRIILLQIKVSFSAVGLGLWRTTPFGKAKVGYISVASGRLYEKVLLGFQLSFESMTRALFEFHRQKKKKKKWGRPFLIFANIYFGTSRSTIFFKNVNILKVHHVVGWITHFL